MNPRPLPFLLLAATACSASPSPIEALRNADAATRTDAAPLSPNNDGGTAANICSVSACGGTLDGKWKFVDACQSALAPSGGFCKEQTSSNRSHLEGTASFADGWVTLSTTVVQVTRMHIPKECMPKGVTSCERAVQFVPPVSGVCTEASASGFCDCEGRSTSAPTSTKSPYDVQGASLHIESDNEGDSFTYCVTGDSLVFANANTGERSYLQRE